MLCKHPIRLRDGREFNCGKCMPCRISKTREWTVRLLYEKKMWDKASMITLTFRDNPESVCVRDLQLFFKRMRKGLAEDEKIRYFACGEYGELYDRPHYHAIVFGFDPEDKVSWYHTPEGDVWRSATLEKLWPFGFSSLMIVNATTIAYVCGYVRKKLNGTTAKSVYGKNHAPFQLQSQGLGLNFALATRGKLEKSGLWHKGQRMGIPRYFREKLEIEVPPCEATRKTWERRGISVDQWGEPLSLYSMDTYMKDMADRERRANDMILKEDMDRRKHEKGLRDL